MTFLAHRTRHLLSCTLCLATLIGAGATASAADKTRVVVLTDIENEPDDAQSMVRFLT